MIKKSNQKYITLAVIKLCFRQNRISVHESSLFHVLFKLVSNLNCKFRNLVLFSVVLYTVVKNKFHVINELLNVVINIVI